MAKVGQETSYDATRRLLNRRVNATQKMVSTSLVHTLQPQPKPTNPPPQ